MNATQDPMAGDKEIDLPLRSLVAFNKLDIGRWDHDTRPSMLRYASFAI